MNRLLIVLCFICLNGYGQKKYGDPDFSLNFSDTILVTSSDTSVARVYQEDHKWMVQIMKAGEVDIITDSTVEKLIIDKAPLTITAQSFTKCYGMPDPTFTVSYKGWVYDESDSVLTSLPTVRADATNTLIPSGAAAENYDITYVNGLLTVNKLPAASIKADKGTVVCGTKPLPLSASGKYAYTWMRNDSIIGKGSSLDVTAPGDYKAIAVDVNGCSNTSNIVTMTQVLPPVVDFAYASGCTGTSVYFTNKTKATGPIDYNWHSGDGQSSENNSASFTYAKVGTYTVVLTATPQACPSMGGTSIHDVTIKEPMAAKALPAVKAEPGKPVQLNARKLEAATYEWMPNNGLTDTKVSDPKAILKAPETYYIKMTQMNGCITTDTLRVSVANPKAFMVQEEFSPNGDKQNDLLQVYAKTIKTITSFDILDSMGNQVYQKSKKGEVAWDGTNSKGKKVPEGIYIWMAVGNDYYGKVVREQGTVKLTR
ncbi:MBG domain-containing protein [Chitinophaga sp.]|uniref:MBG domain-containing protein n=1 Tax=Chitinophaga sp. TaxID=1869181 RepID=UPI0031E02A42